MRDSDRPKKIGDGLLRASAIASDLVDGKLKLDPMTLNSWARERSHQGSILDPTIEVDDRVLVVSGLTGNIASNLGVAVTSELNRLGIDADYHVHLKLPWKLTGLARS